MRGSCGEIGSRLSTGLVARPFIPGERGHGAGQDESNYLNAAFSCPWHAIIPSAGSRLSKGLDSMYLQLWRGRKMGGRGNSGGL